MMKRSKWWKDFQSLFQQKLRIIQVRFLSSNTPWTLQWEKKGEGSTSVLRKKSEEVNQRSAFNSKCAVKGYWKRSQKYFVFIHLSKVNCFHSWKTFMVHHFLLYCKTTPTFQGCMLFSWLNFTTLSQTNWEAKTQGGIIEVLAHIYKKKNLRNILNITGKISIWKTRSASTVR